LSFILNIISLYIKGKESYAEDESGGWGLAYGSMQENNKYWYLVYGQPLQFFGIIVGFLGAICIYFDP
jgi:hypothetical protein